MTLENRVRATIVEGIWIAIWTQNSSKTVLSGTALSIPDLREMIDQWVDLCGEVLVQWEPDLMNLRPSYKIISDFQRIHDFLPFWDLY